MKGKNDENDDDDYNHDDDDHYHHDDDDVLGTEVKHSQCTNYTIVMDVGTK